MAFAPISHHPSGASAQGVRRRGRSLRVSLALASAVIVGSACSSGDETSEQGSAPAPAEVSTSVDAAEDTGVDVIPGVQTPDTSAEGDAPVPTDPPATTGDDGEAAPTGLPMSEDTSSLLPERADVEVAPAPDLTNRIIEVGTGPQAVVGSTILVSWTMTDLATGEIVDTSEAFGGEVELNVGTGMLPAPVDDAIAGLPLGSTIRIVIEPGEAILPPHVSTKATYEVVMHLSETDPFGDG